MTYYILHLCARGVALFTLIREESVIVGGYRNNMEPSVLRNLMSGRWTPQRTLDLHGFLQKEARIEIKNFIENASASKAVCVIVVHGKGLHSKYGEPVLHKLLVDTLTSMPTASKIRAFCFAPPNKGGSGATLVLLTKQHV